jgi:hypothetical protein
MPKKQWLGDGHADPRPDPLALDQAKALPFQADDRYTSTEAGRHVNPEHDRAIEAAMKPLYGGMVGSRCDPVEEWPGDHDELYGMPQQVREGVPVDRTYGEADRDDEKPIVADKPGAPNRRIGVSDLSGASDRIADDDDFAERNEHDDDQGLITHH